MFTSDFRLKTFFKCPATIAGFYFPHKESESSKSISSLQWQSLSYIPYLSDFHKTDKFAHRSKRHRRKLSFPSLAHSLFLAHCIAAIVVVNRISLSHTNEFLISFTHTHTCLPTLSRIPVFLLIIFPSVCIFMLTPTYTLKNKRNSCSSTYREKIKYNPIHIILKSFKTKNTQIEEINERKWNTKLVSKQLVRKEDIRVHWNN